MDQIKQVSKWLSRHLRHPSNLLHPDSGGWVSIRDLLYVAPEWINRGVLQLAVDGNDKQRFTIQEDRIRANQGHTIPVDLGLVAVVPPEVLYHGTYHEAVRSIECQGLRKMKRHHVHLASEVGTAVTVGLRSGTPVVFRVFAGMMHRNGIIFYQSVNGVWLVDFVHPSYLKRMT